MHAGKPQTWPLLLELSNITDKGAEGMVSDNQLGCEMLTAREAFSLPNIDGRD